MFFRKKNKKESRLKKVDGLVTGIIIAGAVAGVVGLSQTKKGKKIIADVKENQKDNISKSRLFFGKSYEKLGSILAKGVSFFNKK